LLIEFPFLPCVTIESKQLNELYKDWINNWLAEIHDGIEKHEISSSTCLAGVISEIWINGRLKTDWIGIMKEFLEDDGLPLAYSEDYSKKLFHFNQQWKQSPIHAIFARWWIERIAKVDERDWAETIKSYIQPNGWIYNPKVSVTNVRTRKRTELFMSMHMGCQILKPSEFNGISKDRLIAAINSIPSTKYVSAEYFRYQALRLLDAIDQMATNIAEILTKCQTEPGFSDFSIEDKTDDYMGSKKRVTRDKAVFSPMSTLFALYLAHNFNIPKQLIANWRKKVQHHLTIDPLDIPALQMRDLTPNFGDGTTIFEVLAASVLLQSN